VKAWDAQLQSTEIIADLACRLAELDGVEEDPHGDAGQEGEGELDLAHRAPLGVAARTYRRGDRESVWIRPARRHAPKRAGGGARVLLGRLGHVGVGP